VGYAACTGGVKNAYRIFVRKHDGKKFFGKLRLSCKDGTEIHLKETECEDVDHTHLALVQGSVTDSRKHGNKLLGFIKGREFLKKLSDYQLLFDVIRFYESHNVYLSKA
jgi:hypothetical protein